MATRSRCWSGTGITSSRGEVRAEVRLHEAGPAPSPVCTSPSGQRPRRPQRLPVVLTVDEVTAVLARMAGEHGLLARLLYGTGMRINEALRLRVKDVDFDRLTLVVRQGKGDKDRALMLPQRLAADLRAQLA
jgi:integrase